MCRQDMANSRKLVHVYTQTRIILPRSPRPPLLFPSAASPDGKDKAPTLVLGTYRVYGCGLSGLSFLGCADSPIWGGGSRVSGAQAPVFRV